MTLFGCHTAFQAWSWHTLHTSSPECHHCPPCKLHGRKCIVRMGEAVVAVLLRQDEALRRDVAAPRHASAPKRWRFRCPKSGSQPHQQQSSIETRQKGCHMSGKGRQTSPWSFFLRKWNSSRHGRMLRQPVRPLPYNRCNKPLSKGWPFLHHPSCAVHLLRPLCCLQKNAIISNWHKSERIKSSSHYTCSNKSFLLVLLC